jgi:hypothetical protein
VTRHLPLPRLIDVDAKEESGRNYSERSQVPF